MALRKRNFVSNGRVYDVSLVVGRENVLPPEESYVRIEWDSVNTSKIVLANEVDTSVLSEIFEGIGANSVNNLPSSRALSSFVVTPAMVETFHGLVDVGMPFDLAFDSASRSRNKVFADAVSLIRETGARLLVDNNNLKNSVGLFITTADNTDVETAQRLFKVFGSSIEQQSTASVVSEMIQNCVDEFSLVPDEAIIPTVELLRTTRKDSEILAIIEMVSDVPVSSWPVIGAASETINTIVPTVGTASSSLFGGFEDESKIPFYSDFNVSLDKIVEQYAFFYDRVVRGKSEFDRLIPDPSRRVKYAAIFMALVAAYGFDVIERTVNKLNLDENRDRFDVLQFVAVASHIGRYDDEDTPVHIILDLAGLPDIKTINSW